TAHRVRGKVRMANAVAAELAQDAAPNTGRRPRRRRLQAVLANDHPFQCRWQPGQRQGGKSDYPDQWPWLADQAQTSSLTQSHALGNPRTTGLFCSSYLSANS